MKRDQTQHALIFPDQRVPPPISGDDLMRPRVTALIERSVCSRLAVLAAPAGYGKTIALSHWRHEDPEEKLVAWINLGHSDADEGVVLASLLMSLEASISGKASKLVEPVAYRDTTAALAQLHHTVSQIDRPVYLVIDAGERLVDETLSTVLAPMLHRLPDNSHFVIACRRVPHPLVSELADPRKVALVEGADLAFDEQEVRRYLRLPPNAELQTQILTAIRGWPLTLHFVAQLRRREGDGAEPGRILKVEGGAMAHLIRERVLQPLSEEALNVLATASAFGRVSLRLAAEVAGVRDIEATVSELLTLRPLVAEQARRPESFVMHPLLRATIRASDAGDRTPRPDCQLHAKAIDHLIERRAIRDALDVAEESESAELARKVLEAFSVYDITLACGMTSLRSVMLRLDRKTVESSARLTLSHAALMVKDGHFNDAEALLQHARRILAASDEDQSVLNDITRDQLGTELLFSLYSNRNLNRESLLQGEKTAANLGDDGFLGFIHALRALLHYRAARFTECSASARRSARLYNAVGSHYGGSSVLLIEGLCAVGRGQLRKAQDCYQQARDVIHAFFARDPGLNAIAETLRCEIAYETGDTSELAKTCASNLSTLEANDGWLDAYLVAYRVSTAVALAKENVDEAIVILDRAETLAGERGLTALSRYACLLRARVMLAAGDAAAASTEIQSVADHRETDDVAPDWREGDERELVTAELALAEDRHHDASRRTGQLLASSRAQGRLHTAIRAAVLQAEALAAMARVDDAIESLRIAVQIGRSGGYVRVFVERGVAIAHLLQALVDESRSKPHLRKRARYCARLLRELSEDATSSPAAIHLVPRELQALHALAQRKANKVIARELSISESTVKYHLRNVYAKLGVNRRAAAVVEARRLGLIT